MEMKTDRENNIALAQQIAEHGNCRVNRIIHLATLAASCNEEIMEDFCNCIVYHIPNDLAEHRLPYVREFYEQVSQLIAEVGMMDSDAYQQISEILLETGTCGYLLEAARPMKDSWGCNQIGYFYAETYAAVLEEARAWAESEAEAEE